MLYREQKNNLKGKINVSRTIIIIEAERKKLKVLTK